MPPLLDGVISFLGIRSRFGAAVSDDEASDFVVGEDAPVKKVINKKLPKPEEPIEDLIEDDDPENDEAEDEDEDDETGEGEFVVEAIKSHLVTDGQIMYHVKWEGYEKRSDMTWEPEENLLPSAEEILNTYLRSVGGRNAILGDEVQKKEPKAKKRGRAPSSTNTPESKQNGKRPRKNAAHPAAAPPPVSLEKAAFKPPTGSWEDDVQGIDACEGTDGNVMVFLQWASGHKTQHPLEQVYKRCPQKMLKFYESHLSFTPAIHASELSTDVLTESSKKRTGRTPGRPRKQIDPRH